MYYFVAHGYDIPITNMFDVDGDETDDPSLAMYVVAQVAEDHWLGSKCRKGDIVLRVQ